MVARRKSDLFPVLAASVEREHVVRAVLQVITQQMAMPTAVERWLRGETEPSDPVVSAVQDVVVAVDRLVLSVRLEARAMDVDIVGPADVVRFVQARLVGGAS